MGWLRRGQFVAAPMADRRRRHPLPRPGLRRRPAPGRGDADASATRTARATASAPRATRSIREIFRRPMTSAGGVMLAAAADRGGRHRALPRRRHPSRPARPRLRLLLPERPGARHPDLAGRRARADRLSRHRRPSRRRRAGRLPRRRPRADHQRARGRALAVHRAWHGPRRRRRAQLPGARRASTTARCAAADARRDPAADPGAPAAGDLPAMRRRRAGGGPAGPAVAVQQRALGGGATPSATWRRGWS